MPAPDGLAVVVGGRSRGVEMVRMQPGNRFFRTALLPTLLPPLLFFLGLANAVMALAIHLGKIGGQVSYLIVLMF